VIQPRDFGVIEIVPAIIHSKLRRWC